MTDTNRPPSEPEDDDTEPFCRPLAPDMVATRDVYAICASDRVEASVRARIQSGLDLPGWPLVLLQLGRARTTRPTARRPPGELTGPR